jgi:hypothetical protein
MKGTLYLEGGIPTIGRECIEVEQDFEWNFFPKVGMVIRFWYGDVHYDTEVTEVIVNLKYVDEVEPYLTVQLDSNLKVRQRVSGFPKMEVDNLGTVRFDARDLVEVLNGSGWDVPAYRFMEEGGDENAD